ncbi:MAG: FHA domain-containing protein [Kofleriaceae bacterium]
MLASTSLSFRIFQNNQLVREQQLAQAVIKIGKVPSAHVRLDDESVSRMHAIIEVTGDEAHIIDLGSTRGTFVNGQKINKAQLRDGDSVTIGDTRLDIGVSVRVAAPVAAPRVVAPPPFTAPAVAAAAPQQFTVTEDAAPGARAIEVAAMLGDSVVDVKHCMDPHGGKVTRATWGFVAGGTVALLASVVAFTTSVDISATNEAKREVLLRSGAPERAHRPQPIGTGTSILAFGGLALGLLGVTTALARARRERRSPYYRIGTAPGVEQPVEGAPGESFPLVAPQGDDFVFNYGAGMEGELTVDGTSTPLSELAAQGRARPSATTAGAIEIPIPARARIRARLRNTTFLVSAVAKPRGHTLPLFASFDRRTAGYVAGSLGAHLALVLFLRTIPADDAGVNIDSTFLTDLEAKTSGTVPEDPAPEVPEDTSDGAESGDQGVGAKMALPEGASGKPDANSDTGHVRIKNTNLDPQLARAEALAPAREAGVLGATQAIQDSISAVTGTSDLSSGFDASNIYGPLYGAEGEGRGTFGFGRKGFDVGGGCYGSNCGLVGDGRYGTIGNGREVGDGYGGSRGRGGLRGRVAAVPPVVP